jgi:hypothetical protein
VSRDQRQKAILAVLLVGLGIVLWRQLSGSPGRPAPGSSGRSRERSNAAAAEEVLELDLAQLAYERAVYSPGRDPFRYGPAPAPPPDLSPKPDVAAARAAARERAATAGEGGARAGRGAGGGRPPRPRAPEVNVQYLGSFGSQAERIAVFLDGEEIINAKLGDILKGQFIVQGIGFESADLGFVGFPEEPSQRLPAGG